LKGRLINKKVARWMPGSVGPTAIAVQKYRPGKWHYD